MTEFTLDPQLAADTFAVCAAPLCAVRLMNDARYPWLILVPRRNGLRELHELSTTELSRFWTESTHVARALMDLTDGDKLNVAALGNVVAQLHVHHVVRFQGDDAWPGPVWGAHPRRPYPAEAADRFLTDLRAVLPGTWPPGDQPTR
jgi:diadenosine tetraphosphate (Ap4A) HIT family hydrolase